MPEISRFYGIVVTMYPEAGERHSTPHFHARYGSNRATISIESGELLAGALPKPQLRLLQAWVELRRLQLDADWNLLIAGNSPDKIAPLTTEEWMNHELHTVIDFAIIAPYTLRIQFEDGHTQIIDFLPMARGEMFGPLRALSFFNQVVLDTEAGTIVWPNGADFDPATLHDWDRVGPAMIAMAKTWTDSPTPEYIAHSVTAVN